MNLDVQVRLAVVVDTCTVKGGYHYIIGCDPWITSLFILRHSHLFVQVLATPTSSYVPVDNVLMLHWRAIEYLIAMMEVMRLAAHVS